ncbi:MAG: YlbF family regulator [Bacilli bacterium]
MTEKEELIQQAIQLTDDFKSLPLYQRYLSLKEALKNDQRLSDLLKEYELLKGSLKFLSGDEKKKTLEKAQGLFKTYEEDPLVVNFRQAKYDLLLLIDPLSKASL